MHVDTAEFEKAGRGRTDGLMDGRTVRWMDGRTDGWTDRPTYTVLEKTNAHP